MDEAIITPSQPHPTDSKKELERQFAIFSVLWSLAALLAVWHRFDAGFVQGWSMLLHVAVGVAAIAQLIRPHLAIPCVLLGALQVVFGMVQMPFVSATDVLWMFFGGAICISYLSTSVAHRSFAVNAIGMFRSFAPCLRIILVTALTALAIARWNWTFLRLESSPVVATLGQFRGVAVVPDWIAHLTASMLLIVDLFLPLSLLIPRLRRFAVGFGSCYFAWQAAFGFGEVRVMLPLILVGLFLFTSMELASRIHALFDRWIPLPKVRAVALPAVTILLSTAIVAVTFSPRNAALPTNQQFVVFGYTAFILIWSSALVSNLIDGLPRLTWISLMLRNPAHYAWIGLFVMVVASPYLGLGTWGRFSDSSGLETFGGRNNHLFVPQAYLVEYQKDVVEVIGSSDVYLDQVAREETLLTWFDLVNYLNHHPDTSLTFVRDGEEFAVDRAGDITEFSTKNGWIPRKLLGYRPMQKTLVAKDQMARVID